MRESRARSTVRPPKPESNTPTIGPRFESAARLMGSIVRHLDWRLYRAQDTFVGGPRVPRASPSPGHLPGIAPVRSVEDSHARFPGLKGASATQLPRPKDAG